MITYTNRIVFHITFQALLRSIYNATITFALHSQHLEQSALLCGQVVTYYINEAVNLMVRVCCVSHYCELPYKRFLTIRKQWPLLPGKSKSNRDCQFRNSTVITEFAAGVAPLQLTPSYCSSRCSFQELIISEGRSDCRSLEHRLCRLSRVVWLFQKCSHRRRPMGA